MPDLGITEALVGSALVESSTATAISGAATSGLIGSGGLIGGVMAPSTAMGLGSLAMTGLGTISGMNAQEAAGESAAKVASYQADQTRAATNQVARQERRKGEIAISNAVAAGAASGGSVSDPSMMNIVGGIADESEYRALTALYEGNEKASGLVTQGQISKQAGRMNANTTMFSGLGSMDKQTLLDLYG